MNLGDKVKINNLVPGDCCTDFVHIFEIVRSGDVMPSFSPDTPVLRMLMPYPRPEHDYKIEYKTGQILANYFDADAYYFGKRDELNFIIHELEKINEDTRLKKKFS